MCAKSKTLLHNVHRVRLHTIECAKCKIVEQTMHSPIAATTGSGSQNEMDGVSPQSAPASLPDCSVKGKYILEGCILVWGVLTSLVYYLVLVD